MIVMPQSPALDRVPSHVRVDERGVARIDGTRIKVLHIAKERVARGSSADDILQAFPHLTLAQVHSALAYYYDHQSDLDAQMAREAQEFEQLSAEARAAGSPLRQKLRELGHRE